MSTLSYEKGRADARKDFAIHGYVWVNETALLMEHADKGDYTKGYVDELCKIREAM
jgi:hypothetical protein